MKLFIGGDFMDDYINNNLQKKRIYLKEIKRRINNINNFVTNPINYKDINNPFASTLPKTYVWIEDDKK